MKIRGRDFKNPKKEIIKHKVLYNLKYILKMTLQ